MNKIKRNAFWIALILPVLGLLIFALSIQPTRAGPVFTGDAAADFTALDVQFVPDPSGLGDVGIPLGPPAPPSGTVSGWDMAGAYFDYDHAADTMYVGIDCVGICGDADGDGDPDTTSAWLAGQGGSDLPDLAVSEAIAVLFDGNLDLDADVAVGVNDDAASSLATFGAYTRQPGMGFNVPALSFFWTAALPNPTTYITPSPTSPDLEFFVEDFSTLPSFSFTPGDSFSFNVLIFAGSQADGGIGEDFIDGANDPALVTIPAAPALGDRVWEDIDMDGIQDGGEPGVPDVTVDLYQGCTPGDYFTTTTTGPSGYYTFTLLEPGDYYVSFTLPSGYIFTLQDQGGDNAVDSDVNPANGQAVCVNPLMPGVRDPTWDAGIFQVLDFGDAPDSYSTLLASMGASHILDPNIYLGSCVDAEPDGQPSAGADGDDTNIGSPVYGSCAGDDDEDGVTFTTPLYPGMTADVDVIANADCDLSAWIDFNANGDWNDAGENIFNGQTIVAGLNPLSFSVPAGATPGDTYARFRCTTDGAVAYTGQASDGEVEDYTVTISPLLSLGDYVWYDTNQDGIQDASETGVSGVTVSLYDGGGAFQNSTSTGASGYYSFVDLPPGDYYVSFVLPSGYVFSPQDQGTDDALDSDADPTTGVAITTTLTAGENDLTWDAGIYSTLGQKSTIDEFSVDQPLLQLVAPGDVGRTISSTVSGPDILSGTRDIVLNMTNGPAGNSISTQVNADRFTFNQEANVTGAVQVQWDGNADPTPDILDFTGLGGMDLTSGASQDAFLLYVIVEDVPANIILTVYTDMGNFSEYTIALPGFVSNQTFVIPYADFTPVAGTGADFGNVGAVTLDVVKTAPAAFGLDLSLDYLRTTSILYASKDDLLLIDNNGDGQANPGDTLQYTVVISNMLDSVGATASNVVFSDTPSVNTTLVTGSVTTTQGVVSSGNTPGDTSIGVDVGDVLDDSIITVTFQATINDPFPIGVFTVSNQGFINSDTVTNLSTDDPQTPAVGDPTGTLISNDPQFDLAIVKTVGLPGKPTVEIGDTLVYTISVQNNGTLSGTYIGPVDSLPSGVAFLDATPGYNYTSTLSWNPAPVAIGPSQAHVYTATVRVDACGVLTNTATVIEPGTAAFIFSDTVSTFVPCVPSPIDVSLSCPTVAATGDRAWMSAIINPLTATVPMTYTWQAGEQTEAVLVRDHTYDFDWIGDFGLNINQAWGSFAWDTGGARTVTFTAANAEGNATDTCDIMVSPPPVVVLTGPMSGTIDTTYTFTATVSPGSAQVPIDYVWTVTDHSFPAQTGGLSNTIAATWTTTGTKLIQVEAINGVGRSQDSIIVEIFVPLATPLATIWSVNDGDWLDPATWNLDRTPVSTDVVAIQPQHTVDAPESIAVESLINQGTMQGSGYTALVIAASDYISNTGVIRASAGQATSSHPACDATVGTTGHNITLLAASLLNNGRIQADNGPNGWPGGGVTLVPSPNTSVWNGPLGAICAGRGGEGNAGNSGGDGGTVLLGGSPVTNKGVIRAGDGGGSDFFGGDGGSAFVFGRDTTNVGSIGAGNGGDTTDNIAGARGGNGGETEVWGKYFSWHGSLFNTGDISAGNGGSGNPSATNPQHGGCGGSVLLMAWPNVFLTGGTVTAGTAGIPSAGGMTCWGGWIWIDPAGISVSGDTRIRGNDVVIYGGDDWTLDLKSLDSETISATGNITLAVGSGGVIDLRGNTEQVLNAAGQVNLYADEILLDPGVPLFALAGANVITGPGRILHNVSVAAPTSIAAQPGDVVSFTVQVLNAGPVTGTFALSQTNPAGWSVSGLPSEIEVGGIDNYALTVSVVVPSDAQDASLNEISIYADLQDDPSVNAQAQIIVTVTKDDFNIYLPLVLKN